MIFSYALYASEIIPFNSDENLNKFLLNYIEEIDSPKNTWFIWDVDNVLITTVDIFGRPQGQKICQPLLREGVYNQEIQDMAFGLMMVKSTYKLFNKNNEIIKKLNRKKYMSLALTGLRTDIKDFENLLDWRIEQLKNFDIHFSSNILYSDGLQINFEDGMSFKNNILFSGTKTKGQALTLLCRHTNKKPKKIVMIDDSLHAVESVQCFCSEEHITFLGLHYQDDQIFNENIPDPNLISIQLDTLIRTHEMVSYETVKDKFQMTIKNKSTANFRSSTLQCLKAINNFFQFFHNFLSETLKYQPDHRLKIPRLAHPKDAYKQYLFLT